MKSLKNLTKLLLACFILAILAITITVCSSDKDNNPNNPESTPAKPKVKEIKCIINLTNLKNPAEKLPEACLDIATKENDKLKLAADHLKIEVNGIKFQFINTKDVGEEKDGIVHLRLLKIKAYGKLIKVNIFRQHGNDALKLYAQLQNENEKPIGESIEATENINNASPNNLTLTFNFEVNSKGATTLSTNDKKIKAQTKTNNANKEIIIEGPEQILAKITAGTMTLIKMVPLE